MIKEKTEQHSACKLGSRPKLPSRAEMTEHGTYYRQYFDRSGPHPLVIRALNEGRGPVLAIPELLLGKEDAVLWCGETQAVPRRDGQGREMLAPFVGARALIDDEGRSTSALTYGVFRDDQKTGQQVNEIIPNWRNNSAQSIIQAWRAAQFIPHLPDKNFEEMKLAHLLFDESTRGRNWVQKLDERTVAAVMKDIVFPDHYEMRSAVRRVLCLLQFEKARNRIMNAVPGPDLLVYMIKEAQRVGVNVDTQEIWDLIETGSIPYTDNLAPLVRKEWSPYVLSAVDHLLREDFLGFLAKINGPQN